MNTQTNWEEEFDENFYSLNGTIYPKTQNGYRAYKDLKDLKFFIRKQIEEARKQGYREGVEAVTKWVQY